MVLHRSLFSCLQAVARRVQLRQGQAEVFPCRGRVPREYSLLPVHGHTWQNGDSALLSKRTTYRRFHIQRGCQRALLLPATPTPVSTTRFPATFPPSCCGIKAPTHVIVCRRHRLPHDSPDCSEYCTAVTDVGRHEQVAHQQACRDRRAVLPAPVFIRLLQNFGFGRGERCSQKPLESLRWLSPQARPRSRLGNIRVELDSSGGNGGAWEGIGGGFQ